MKRRRLLFNTMEIDLESLMYIEALEDGLSVSFSRNTIYYSIDEAKTWASLSPNTATPVINAGCKIYFKARNLTPSSSNGIGTFTINKKCKAGGNIMSLALEQLKSYHFYRLFYNCTNLIEVSKDFLPATTLASNCYNNMFEGCSSLISAPELLATTLANSCYYYMFSGCTSLTTAPELPATTLTERCYSGMFYGCSSLTTAPELPATTLASYCYESMFSDCTSLTTAPELSATTLAIICYAYMFYNCPQIDFIKMHATDISASNCLRDWVYGVASTGTFVKNKDATWNVIGTSGVPTGWVVKKDNEAIKQINYKEVTINKAYDVIGCDTSTTIEYTAIVDGIAYDGTVLENITITDYAESDVFEQNTSNNTITRTIYLTLGNIILSTTILQGPWQDPDTSYTYFKALENNFLVSFSGKIKYLVEGESKWTYKQSRPLNKGEKVYVLGMLYDGYSGSSGIGTFKLINKGIVGGNSNALISIFNNTLKSYQFSKLFYNCTNLIEVSKDFLPITELAKYCYKNMFYGCISLTTAPELPATTLAGICYESMFEGCKSLTKAPELPTTTLTYNCYWRMFSGCTSLVTAPELPATTLTDWCYLGMFSGCKSLTKAPELPATTLTERCYDDMFGGCTSLVTAPVLPATQLDNYCYRGMFSGCTSLVTAPELPATTLTAWCYESMFDGCTSLTEAPELPATQLANRCYGSMFGGCTSLVTAPVLPAVTLAYLCYSTMFDGCTSLTEAPELPATTLSKSCYLYMFDGCTSLVSAPELPAVTLADSCYYSMFYGCTNLNYIKMLATDISANLCLSNWVANVASTGTFVKNVDATWDVVGSNGVPEGWEIDFNITITECTLLSIIANDVPARSTSTTITYTALVNGIDEFGNTVTNKKITKTVESDPFPQNTSETETVTRTISYTYMGVTATTTITQGVWVNQKYILNLNDLWQSSTVANPDSSLYDGVYESFSNKGVDKSAAIMYITINDCTNFSFYIRSYAESSYDYVMVSQLDLTITYTTSYNSTDLVKAHTRSKSTSGTALSNYTLVEFTDIDEGEHTITVLYRKDSSGSSGDDKGYILIPINQ